MQRTDYHATGSVSNGFFIFLPVLPGAAGLREIRVNARLQSLRIPGAGFLRMVTRPVSKFYIHARNGGIGRLDLTQTSYSTMLGMVE